MEGDPIFSEFSADHDEWTASQLARAFGVSLRTIRVYEDKGVLAPRHRGRYRHTDRLRLQLILKGKRLGFTLTEILELVRSRHGTTVLDQVYRKAVETFGTEEKAERWLHRPTTALSDKSPLEVSSKDTEGVGKVLDLLKRIDHGLAV